jgi:hypothetical protein
MPLPEDFFDLPSFSTGDALDASWVNATRTLLDPLDRTAAEISAGVTPVNFAVPTSPEIDVKRHGALSTNSNATNKTHLQTAISVGAEMAGGAVIVVPSDINYGYDVDDLSTHPDFTGVDVPVTVMDYGPGASFAGFPTAYDGAQVRMFFHTPQTTSFGQHMGNTQYIRANWNPGIFIVNDADLAAVGNPARLASDNRRCQLSFGNDGEEGWKIGQGTLADAGLTDEELSNFALQKVAMTGDTLGSFGSWIVERKTGNHSFGAATNAPPASFHFNSPVTGFYQAMFETEFDTESSILLRNSVGVNDDCGLANKAGVLSLFIRAVGDALQVNKTNRRLTIATAIIHHITTVTYSASMTLDAAEGNIFIITATDGNAFTINAPSNPVIGQRISITIKNSSSGALGSATWNAAFKMSTWTNPADTNQRSIEFYYDNTNWIQVNPAGVDVPN